MEIVYVTEPAGDCICGFPAYTIVAGVPLHPCCATEGPSCEPCRISRGAKRRWDRRQEEDEAA